MINLLMEFCSSSVSFHVARPGVRKGFTLFILDAYLPIRPGNLSIVDFGNHYADF